MPIVRKSDYKRHMEQLEQRCQNLLRVARGNAPNMNIWNKYALNESDYERDFLEVDANELKLAIQDVRAILNILNSPGKLAAEPLPK